MQVSKKITNLNSILDQFKSYQIPILNRIGQYKSGKTSVVSVFNSFANNYKSELFQDYDLVIKSGSIYDLEMMMFTVVRHKNTVYISKDFDEQFSSFKAQVVKVNMLFVIKPIEKLLEDIGKNITEELIREALDSMGQ